jgi:hypothetical protein
MLAAGAMVAFIIATHWRYPGLAFLVGLPTLIVADSIGGAIRKRGKD